MARKSENEALHAEDRLAERYHELGISAVSAAARYCEPLKKERSEPPFYKMLEMVEPKID